jgi:DNA-binding NarL/FixJ family response regulator
MVDTGTELLQFLLICAELIFRLAIYMKQSIECRSTRLVLYTEDTLLAFGAGSVLASLPQFHVVIAEPELFALVPLVEKVRPEIILLDLAPEMTLGLISALRSAVPEARVIVWGRSFSEEVRHQAREMGVAGFLARNISKEQFVENLIGVGGGDSLFETEKPANSRKVSLTRRESQLVTLLAQGLKNKEIAACIGITEGTVRIYLSKLFVKIGARDRFEVAVFGLKNAYCGQASWDGQNGFVTEADEERARPILRSLVLVEPERRRGYTRQAKAVGE